MSPQPDINLQPFNTLATPSRAQWYMALRQPPDFQAALQFARSTGESLWVLGGGSNVVLGDRVPGLALHQCSRGRQVLAETDDTVTVVAAAGENWHQFVQWTVSSGWSGLENLALIPGTVGAAPIQNIGAYGVEVSDFVTRVAVRHLASGQSAQMSPADCEFGYRDSIFKGELRDAVLVEEVEFVLPRQAPANVSYPALAHYLAEQGVTEPTPQQVFDAVVAIRSSKLPDPEQLPNVGSFFKNPQLDERQWQTLQGAHPGVPGYPQQSGVVRVPAGWLVEQCGFKKQQQAVRVHSEHALVIINPEQRAASEIRQLAAQIQAAVEQRFAIMLEQEPRDYG